MTFVSDVGSTFERFINKHGSTIKYQLKNTTFTDSDYDDATYSASGNVIDSYKAVMVNINTSPHGDDYAFVKQGLVHITDKKLYLPGNCTVDEKADVVINAGSFWVVKLDNNYISGTVVYKRAFIRSTAPLEASTYG